MNRINLKHTVRQLSLPFAWILTSISWGSMVSLLEATSPLKPTVIAIAIFYTTALLTVKNRAPAQGNKAWVDIFILSIIALGLVSLVQTKENTPPLPYVAFFNLSLLGLAMRLAEFTQSIITKQREKNVR